MRAIKIVTVSFLHIVLSGCGTEPAPNSRPPVDWEQQRNKKISATVRTETERVLQDRMEGVLAVARSEAEGAAVAVVNKVLDERLSDVSGDGVPPEVFVTEEELRVREAKVLALAQSSAEGVLQDRMEGFLAVARSEAEGAAVAVVNKVLDERLSDVSGDGVSPEVFVTEEELRVREAELLALAQSSAEGVLQDRMEGFLAVARSEAEGVLQERMEGIAAVLRAGAEETAVAVANRVFEDRFSSQKPAQDSSSAQPVFPPAQKPEEGFETKNYTITLRDTPPATVTFSVLLGSFQQPLRNKGDCVKIKGRDFANLEILITHTMPLLLATLCSFRNTNCFPGHYNINEAPREDGKTGGLFYYSLRPSSPSKSSNCPLLSL